MMSLSEEVMIKNSFALLLLIPLLISPLGATEEIKADPQTTIEWIGKHRDEVIKLLGEPVESKKNAKGEVLVFHGPLEWFAPPDDPRHSSSELLLKPESEKPIRIGVKTTTAAASPADDHEIITDSEGNTVGAYGKPIIAPGTGVVTVHKLKLFLDDKGYVYKTKVGKRVTK
jgi:hypothetical protein